MLTYLPPPDVCTCSVSGGFYFALDLHDVGENRWSKQFSECISPLSSQWACHLKSRVLAHVITEMVVSSKKIMVDMYILIKIILSFY